jgi:hypothetical protein
MADTRKLVITECREERRGETDGREWVRYTVKATKPDGTPIQQPLRSFEALPVGEASELEVKPHEASGTFTLRRPGRRGGGNAGLQRRVDEVESNVLELDSRVGVLELWKDQATGQAPAAAAAAGGGPQEEIPF